MMPMKVLAAATILTSCLLATAAPARPAMSKQAARRAAVAILIGDPYGRTPAAVSRNLVSQEMLTDDYCRTGKRVWKFRVVLRPSATLPHGVDGYLVLDAATGSLVCAGLPLLD